MGIHKHYKLTTKPIISIEVVGGEKTTFIIPVVCSNYLQETPQKEDDKYSKEIVTLLNTFKHCSNDELFQYIKKIYEIGEVNGHNGNDDENEFTDYLKELGDSITHKLYNQ